MRSIGDVLRAEMIKDTTSTTAAAVMALYPGRFARPEDVPEYLYMSLADIWGEADIDKWVHVDISGQTKTAGNIIINEVMVVDSSETPANIDLPGAESAQVDITYQKPRNTLLAQVVRNAELRTRLLLDYTLRQSIRVVAPDLPALDGSNFKIDSSIEDYWIKAFWRGYSIEPTTSYVVSRYRVEYVRLFLRV